MLKIKSIADLMTFDFKKAGVSGEQLTGISPDIFVSMLEEFKGVELGETIKIIIKRHELTEFQAGALMVAATMLLDEDLEHQPPESQPYIM